jgi:hypothetical protein
MRINPELFAKQLRAAGLADLPIAWNTTSVLNLELLTTEQRQAVEAVIAAHDPDAPESLADYKTKAKDAIDQAAGRARAKYITVALGQEATYQAKAAEVDAYVAAGRPANTAPYPILTAEAQARGISVSETADLVRAVRDQWLQLAAAIEGIRIGGKLAVDAAADHAGVDAARDTAITQLEAV